MFVFKFVDNNVNQIGKLNTKIVAKSLLYSFNMGV